MVDMIVHRRDLRDTLIRIVSLLRNRGPAADGPPMRDADGASSATLALAGPANPGKDAEPAAG